MKNSSFPVTSIQSLQMDEKTPTAEMFSPIAEKPKLSQVPMPKQSDFIQSESDPYSDNCLEQLESLDNLDSTLDDTCEIKTTKTETNHVRCNKNNIKLELKPLELKPPELRPQKLVTPGKKIYQNS